MKKTGCSSLLLVCALVVSTWPQPVVHPALERKPIIRSASRSYLLEGPIAGVSKWDPRGYLIHFRQDSDERPLVWVYDGQGKMVSRLAPTRHLAEVQSASFHDVTMTRKRTLLIAATMTNAQDQMASGLLEVDLSGSLMRVIKTDPFVPLEVTTDGDSHIWLLGYDWQQLRQSDEWPLVHKLSAEGKLLLSTLPRSSFTKGFPLRSPGPGILESVPCFEVIGEQVYVWLPGVNQLVVLGLDGRVLERVDKPFATLIGRVATSLGIRSLAFLPGGQLIVQALDWSGGRWPPAHGWFFSADRGRTWLPMAHQLGDPSTAYVALAGWTPSMEAVIIRIVNQEAGVLEFCPVEF